MLEVHLLTTAWLPHAWVSARNPRTHFCIRCDASKAKKSMAGAAAKKAKERGEKIRSLYSQINTGIYVQTQIYNALS